MINFKEFLNESSDLDTHMKVHGFKKLKPTNYNPNSFGGYHLDDVAAAKRGNMWNTYKHKDGRTVTVSSHEKHATVYDKHKGIQKLSNHDAAKEWVTK